MKLNFSKSIGQIGGLPLPLLAGLLLCPMASMGTDALASFSGFISSPPQVDAINFYNSGTWSLALTAPYETANTLTYTNTGTMASSPGWEFDLGPSISGSRTNWSSIFYNDNGATIRANDGTLIYTPEVRYGASSVLVQATNIVNKGQIIATAAGHIKLVGSTVNLSRSALTIPPIQGSGSFNNFRQTNYTADTAIYDEYWGEGLTNLASPAVWGTNLTAQAAGVPNVQVVDPCNGTNSAPFLSFYPSFYAWTNIPDPNSITNLSTNGAPVYATNRFFRQAAFVVVSDPNFVTENPYITGGTNGAVTNALIGFTPTGSISNLFQTVTVTLHSLNAGDLYVVDTLGSLTNRGVLKNNTGLVPGSNPLTSCTAPTYRPANYNVGRLGLFAGSPGNTTFPPGNFLYDSSFSNAIVTADMSAYQAYVDDFVYHPLGQALSSLPGRITIDANNLDLTRTIISDAGPEVVIKANNLAGSAGAVISCQNLSFNLNSSNGTVQVQSLVPYGSLPALHGTISLWSAVWTNYMTVPHTITTPTNSYTTNTTTELDIHVLLVDGRSLSTTVPITVQDFTLQTNAVISDYMNVANSFLFSGQSLTLNGELDLSGNIQNWSRALAPSLLYFTNSGSLNIPQNAYFTNYAAFVDYGYIDVGGSQIINSTYYQVNGGYLIAVTGISATGSTGLIQNALITSSQYISFTADTLQLQGNYIDVGGSLNFSATNSLLDNGFGNTFVCDNGFNLFVSPQSGNLTASIIGDIAPGNFITGIGPEIDHAWAGSDSGASATGTSDNVAIGTLALVADVPSQLPTFRFYGTTGNNAMYVKTLDLSQLTDNPGDLASMIQIDPGMKIYFSSVLASSNFIASLPAGQTPSSYLQATFPGQFIHDANAGLSVGASPDLVISSMAAHPVGSFVLTWNSTAGTTYSVFKSSTLSPATGWPAIVTNYPAGGAIGGPLSYTDTTATVSPAFYRVMAEPLVTK